MAWWMPRSRASGKARSIDTPMPATTARITDKGAGTPYRMCRIAAVYAPIDAMPIGAIEKTPARSTMNWLRANMISKPACPTSGS